MRSIVERRELPQSNVSNLVMYVMFGTAGASRRLVVVWPCLSGALGECGLVGAGESAGCGFVKREYGLELILPLLVILCQVLS